MARTVRIIGVPEGPAPLWVREKWVGLDLPVSPPRVVKRRVWRDFKTRGLFTYFMALLGITSEKLETWDGYVVDVRQAVTILEAKHPDAAAWWRENVPHLMGGKFMFDAAACSINSRDKD